MLEDRQAEVASAARFLDLRLPGWAEEINLDTYDQTEPTKCIGGQLADRLGVSYRPQAFDVLHREWAEIAGGDALGRHNGPFGGGADWLDEIRKRLPAPPAPPEPPEPTPQERFVVESGLIPVSFKGSDEFSEGTRFEATGGGRVRITDHAGDYVVLDVAELLRFTQEDAA